MNAGVNATDSYVSLLLQEWQIKPSKLREAVASALSELSASALFRLRNEPRLQVEMDRGAPETWAYFPIHQGQVGDEHVNLQLGFVVRAAGIRLREDAEILLLLKDRLRRGQNDRARIDEIVHHLGHILLYLRNAKAKNTCHAANRELDRNSFALGQGATTTSA